MYAEQQRTQDSILFGSTMTDRILVLVGPLSLLSHCAAFVFNICRMFCTGTQWLVHAGLKNLNVFSLNRTHVFVFCVEHCWPVITISQRELRMDTHRRSNRRNTIIIISNKYHHHHTQQPNFTASRAHQAYSNIGIILPLSPNPFVHFKANNVTKLTRQG